MKNKRTTVWLIPVSSIYRKENDETEIETN